eukprot:Amastigsp_a678415_28.p4 type:complete len:152 gc:universal Amastigsp_a678415_28:1679-2134(+)
MPKPFMWIWCFSGCDLLMCRNDDLILSVAIRQSVVLVNRKMVSSMASPLNWRRMGWISFEILIILPSECMTPYFSVSSEKSRPTTSTQNSSMYLARIAWSRDSRSTEFSSRWIIRVINVENSFSSRSRAAVASAIARAAMRSATGMSPSTT